jgi:prolyl-tRNA synthetase
VFYLGDKYSKALSATYLDADGKELIIEMGTFGIGVTRTMAAAIEQNHDENGIIWPVSIAPYEVLIVPVKWAHDASREAAEQLYEKLGAAGIDVLMDDRDVRAGVKFNDADLIGVPYRITIGPRGLDNGEVELKARREADAEKIPLSDIADTVIARVVEARGS